jgi:RNA polymerase sigma factor (sigma-70 family)
MPDSTESDAALVARALAGRAEAWHALVERYGGLVFATARKAGLSRDDAEDAAQTVFASLLQSLAAVRDVQRLSKWLIVTTKREAWRLQRVRRRHAGAGEEIDAASDERRANEEGDDDASRHERRQTVLRALGSIDERCQELLRAMFLGAAEGDYSAIGARFGIAVNSVGPIRNRCLRRLLAALDELGFEPSEHGFPAPTRRSG